LRDQGACQERDGNRAAESRDQVARRTFAKESQIFPPDLLLSPVHKKSKSIPFIFEATD